MNVALGFKAHSGWAAMVVVGNRDDDFVVVDRQRVTLVDEEWAKAPYHAAENLEPKVAREKVLRGIEAAHRVVVRELWAIVKRETERGNVVRACAVLVGNPMPSWSVEEILAVHFRMHKAEGVLFQDALSRAAEECGVLSRNVPEKRLASEAEKALGVSAAVLAKKIAAMGQSAGPPWAKDQKDATVAAMIALGLTKMGPA